MLFVKLLGENKDRNGYRRHFWYHREEERKGIKKMMATICYVFEKEDTVDKIFEKCGICVKKITYVLYRQDNTCKRNS